MLPTIGIWRPVELLRQRRAAIVGVHADTLKPDDEPAQALVGVTVEIDAFAGNEPLAAEIVLTPPSRTGGATVARGKATFAAGQSRATAYAFFVNLTMPHEATWYSDNYFDLPAGGSATITVHNAQVALAPQMVTVRCR